MAKYPLSELGHVATDFKSRHIMSFPELGERITKATGVEIKEPSFQQARRSDRGHEALRKVVMDYMRSEDPKLVEASLATYNEYCRPEGA